ncbi:hypothetical protein M404DRAFT_23381 [Pisolithus tinctorius Marx 270]|uniref:Uncharacterized protein n=1 Tax=Pisolithus tinctorius Marx 270 TaxID=870435 RepID=A0A0C3P4V2_PISTI|nr:hypothetical protein M404DRAFT_23381 [Pisolithus tinctorius Marx 270]
MAKVQPNFSPLPIPQRHLHLTLRYPLLWLPLHPHPHLVFHRSRYPRGISVLFYVIHFPGFLCTCTHTRWCRRFIRKNRLRLLQVFLSQPAFHALEDYLHAADVEEQKCNQMHEAEVEAGLIFHKDREGLVPKEMLPGGILEGEMTEIVKELSAQREFQDAFPLSTSSMPLEKHTTTCELCRKMFKPTGIGPHCKLCIRWACKMNEDHAHFDLLRREGVLTGGSVTGPTVEMHAEPAPEPATFWPMVMDLEPPAGADMGANDELNVEYHPNVGKPTVKVPFAKFTQGHAPKTYKPDPCTAPWYLFQTHLDFNLSEFIHDAALNKEQVNCILKLLKHSCTEDWTLNNYNDLESTQQAASHCMTAVKEDKKYSGKKSFANFKNRIWHESFKKILDTISEYSKTGYWLIMKSNSKEQILVKQGLCDVDSAFWEVGNMDVYQALCWDRLHANCAGKFGDHLWGELLRILETMGHQMMGKVEQNLNVMPHWHGLNHFEEALSVSYTDGQKFEDLSKIIILTCHDIFPHEMEKDGYLLLCCLRAYIGFDMYTTLELHMTHTLAAGWEALATFNSLIQKYAEKMQHTGKNWNFPKNHTHMHVFDDIEAKGVTHNFNMKPNEKMHGPLKEAYQKQTNFKDVAQQILNVDHLGLVLEHICCRITEYNAYGLTGKPTNLDNLEAITDEPEEEFFHVKFGSKVKEPLTFKDIEKKSVTDNAFNQFHGKLSEFLNKHFNIIGKPLPGGKPIQFQRNDKIVEYCFVKVNFESTIDWCQYTDYLCCHPNFHGCPCYDCVLVKTQEKDIFGRLILLFNCVIGEETFPLALLQPYDAWLIGQQLQKDNHLNFWGCPSISRSYKTG